MKRWFAPGDDFTVPAVQVDLRVGGRYRIEMRNPEGKPHTAVGVYREIVSPSRLVFTWAWEENAPDSGPGETLVTIELTARGDSTELVLTHDLFPNAEARDNHLKGWTGCVDRLARSL